MNYFETNEAIFNPNLEKIEETDRVHADTPNKRFEQLINNDVAIKNQLYNHNHDGAYSNINHNHNETYANINHKHNEYIENVDLETKLTGLAKERSEYSIEDKVKEIDNKLILLEEKLKDWTLLPNLKTISDGTIYSKNYNIYEVTGSGKLITVALVARKHTVESGKQSYKIVVDDEVLFDIEMDFPTKESNVYTPPLYQSQWGIINNSIHNMLVTLGKNKQYTIDYHKTYRAFYFGSYEPILLDFVARNGVQVPLKAPKSTHSVKSNVISGDYYSVYTPKQCFVDEPIIFKRNFKIVAYNTSGFSDTSSSTSTQPARFNLIYSLDD